MPASASLLVLVLVAFAPLTTKPAAPTLRILSWNIQGCAAGLDPVVADLRRHHADIVCLQESESGTAHTDGADQAALIAKQLDLYQVSAGSAFATGQGEQRMAILARTPLEKSEPLDANTGRIYGLTALARIDGRPVRIVCLHLTNRYWRGLKTALATDDIAAREAADLAHRLETWTEPVILAGDFNAAPPMRAHALIAKNLKRVPTTQPTFPAVKPTLAVDHIYHSPHWQPSNPQVAPTQASDHRPVIADLKPAPPPATAPAR